MKAQYPGKFKESAKYTKTLAWKYLSEYTKFSEEQIEKPISIAIDRISFLIEDFDDYEGVMCGIKTMKRYLDPNFCKRHIPGPYAEGDLFKLVTANEEYLKWLLEDKFPKENQDKYLKFVAQMTKKVIIDICAETEKAIPDTEKTKHHQSQQKIANSLKTDKTHLERLGKRKGSNENLQEILARKKPKSDPDSLQPYK
jgi:hypothetical protein